MEKINKEKYPQATFIKLACQNLESKSILWVSSFDELLKCGSHIGEMQIEFSLVEKIRNEVLNYLGKHVSYVKTKYEKDIEDCIYELAEEYENDSYTETVYVCLDKSYLIGCRIEKYILSAKKLSWVLEEYLSWEESTRKEEEQEAEKKRVKEKELLESARIAYRQATTKSLKNQILSGLIADLKYNGIYHQVLHNKFKLSLLFERKVDGE